MGGQVDRFGQPIPAAPGYGTILNPDGTQPQMRNILRLGTGFTATDDPNSEATSLNVDLTIGGSVQQVNAATNLRNDLFLLGPDVNKIYVTKYYKTPVDTNDVHDTGGMSYRWNATDTTTDDGVLHIKNQFHSTGRFQPIMPPDGMMNAQACGPALADVGSITRSFDPAGTVTMGTEFNRITALLRNSGWNGVFFGRDYVGNASYQCLGNEYVGRSTVPWRGFRIEGIGGARFFSQSVPYNLSLNVAMIFEGNFLAIELPVYTSRNWTQTVNSGDNSFGPVADITGLSVGDTLWVRIGCDPTDASGWTGPWFFGTIKTITPGSGTTGTIVTNESVPEQPSATAGINAFRTPTHHDIVKVTGFQDNTSINGLIFSDVQISQVGYRNLSIDGVWDSTKTSVINGILGIGLYCPRLFIKGASGSTIAPASLLLLAGQYDSRFDNLIINDINPSSSTTLNVMTEELSCRNTAFGSVSISYNAKNVFSSNIQFANQTPGQIDQIYVDKLIVRGGFFQFIIGGNCYINVLEDHCNDPVYNHMLFVRGDQVKSLIYRGQLYRTLKSGDYFLTVPTTPSSNDIHLPFHGITSSLRIYPTTMTGVTSVFISGDSFASTIDITSDLAAGKWCDINQAASTALFGVNFVGYNALCIRVITTGSAAGNSLLIHHDCLENDLLYETHTDDTSISPCIVSNGAPTANASFVSQECFDSANSVWYKSVAVGTGASDWKPSSAGGAIQAGTAALGSLVFTHASPPTTPASGKTAVWCDSTNHIFNAKDASGNVSTTVGASNAIASQWVTGLNTFGSLLRAQPSSVDLSDIAPVALTNANATITVGGGSYYSLAAATLSTLRTLTLGDAGANDKQSIQVRVYAQGSNYLVNDSAATLLWTVTTGNKAVGNFVWNTGTGKFQLQSWNFFT